MDEITLTPDSGFRAFVLSSDGTLTVWMCMPGTEVPLDVAEASAIFTVVLPAGSTPPLDVYLVAAEGGPAGATREYTVETEGGVLRIKSGSETDVRSYGPSGWLTLTSMAIEFKTDKLI